MPLLMPEIICDRTRDNLQVSEDTGMEDQPITVFLFTPCMRELMNHFHIELSPGEALKLHTWLTAFLYKHSVFT